MIKILQSDLLKSKRTLLGLVILLIPSVTIIFEVINFLLREQSLQRLANEMNTDMWHVFLNDKQFILSLSVPVGISIMASMIANMEHQANGWKQLLAFPVLRTKVYLSKFILLFLYSIASATLLFLGMLLFGAIFDLGDVPYGQAFGDSYISILTAIPIMSIQLWLSIGINNQTYSILIGVMSSMVGLFCALSSTLKWLPWAYPIMSTVMRFNYDTKQILYNSDLLFLLFLSLGIGLIILALSLNHFSRKEIL
jgi:hypothetical protein